MLNPVFSIKHMRSLTDVFYSIAHQVSAPPSLRPSLDAHFTIVEPHIIERILIILALFILQLRDELKRRVASGEEEINMLDWMSRAALEYIGQGGLGYSFDALDRSKSNEYAESIKMLLFVFIFFTYSDSAPIFVT